MSFFRKQAHDAASRAMDEPVLKNLPVYHPIRVMGAVCCLVIIWIWILSCPYTEQWSLPGWIDVQGGVMQVLAQHTGLMSNIAVRVGEKVQKHQVLGMMDTRILGGQQDTSQVFVRHYQHRVRLLNKALAHKKAYLKSIRPLWHQHYISHLEYETAKEAYLRLQLEKDALVQEILRYQQSQYVRIEASSSGVISNVIVHVGQQVHAGQSLFTIEPKKPRYIARLEIPVERAGYLNIQDILTLHYDAYPYTQFGEGRASIMSISKTILTAREEKKPFDTKKPYYKATARLVFPGMGGGEPTEGLVHGMQFTAIASGATHRLAAWILLPIVRPFFKRGSSDV